jgi:hypothetical protein
MGLPLQQILRYADGDTVDESWMHHYQPESKRASMQWKHPSSPSAKKFKVTPAAGKVMLTMFWDFQGELLAYF